MHNGAIPVPVAMQEGGLPGQQASSHSVPVGVCRTIHLIADLEYSAGARSKAPSGTLME